jgi:hypothetical protein
MLIDIKVMQFDECDVVKTSSIFNKAILPLSAVSDHRQNTLKYAGLLQFHRPLPDIYGYIF